QRRRPAGHRARRPAWRCRPGRPLLRRRRAQRYDQRRRGTRAPLSPGASRWRPGLRPTRSTRHRRVAAIMCGMDPTTPPAFSTLPLTDALLKGVDALGYTEMTPVQAQGLPPILEGRDLIAQAPTGSGKTAAFGLGLLHRLDPGAVQTQALVLCPTRELADQVGGQLRRLATGVPNVKLSVLCGGIPLAPQLASLAHAPHIVVGTPGRILELLAQG